MKKVKTKYRQGDLIKSVSELLDQREVYWKGEKIGRNLFIHWTLKYARNQVADESLRRVEVTVYECL